MFSPAWIVEAVGKHFGGLVGAVEVRVAPGDGIWHIAHIRVHVQPEHRTCEITEKVERDVSASWFCLHYSQTNAGRLLCGSPSYLRQNYSGSKFHMVGNERKGSFVSDKWQHQDTAGRWPKTTASVGHCCLQLSS